MSPLEPVRKMLENEPDDLFLNFALAMEYLKAGRAEEALTQLTRVREIDPDHVPAYLQAGQAMVSLGRKEEAKAMLTEGMAAAERQGDRHAAEQMRGMRKLLEA